MPLVRYHTADQVEVSSPGQVASPCFEPPLIQASEPFELNLFPEGFFSSLVSNYRSEARSKSRGTILLTALFKQIQSALGEDFHPRSGCYIYALPGPVHSPTLKAAHDLDAERRLETIEKGMPPKDYFIANPAMKAAQIAIEFRLHGPWATFTSLQSGFQQAVAQAKRDLAQGLIPAALVGAFFGLEDPAELWPAEGHSYCEAAWAQYARHSAELTTMPDSWGKYGPLTSELGRLMT